MKRFSEDHVWAEIQDGEATVGITPYAAEELGEITFVEVPETGVVLTAGDQLCVVESSKAASDVFVPLGGTIVDVNTRLENSPELLCSSPEQEGWICRLSELDPKDIDGLMTEQEYETYVAAAEDEE
ncbi:MAG: glycine cleavage system protein GcvH [Lentisphaeria bacterium]